MATRGREIFCQLSNSGPLKRPTYGGVVRKISETLGQERRTGQNCEWDRLRGEESPFPQKTNK
jgi:hypothetical protein